MTVMLNLFQHLQNILKIDLNAPFFHAVLINGEGPTEKGMRTFQRLIPYLKEPGI